MAATKKQHHRAEEKVKRAVDSVLSEDLPKSAMGNALYWVAVVVGGFVLNLLLLLLFARA